MENCPRLSGLQILSRKWSYLVLRALRTPQTFSDVKRDFKVITNRVLTQELRHLEEQAVIEHRAGVYSLTEAGRALLIAMEPLNRWAAQHKNLPLCSPELDCAHCARYQEFIQIK